jgi:hypothetical protein
MNRKNKGNFSWEEFVSLVIPPAFRYNNDCEAEESGKTAKKTFLDVEEADPYKWSSTGNLSQQQSISAGKNTPMKKVKR